MDGKLEMFGLIKKIYLFIFLFSRPKSLDPDGFSALRLGPLLGCPYSFLSPNFGNQD